MIKTKVFLLSLSLFLGVEFKQVQCLPRIADYPYDEVLNLSILFYEAQRCGKLPEDNHIAWRHDSFLDDGQTEGRDLVGGYFDAGDHVKFGFPFAAFTTVLNWGLVDHIEGYQSAGAVEKGRSTVKWSLDYFIKAHPEPKVLYGQTGDGNQDHSYWGRPEEWPYGPRQSFAITANQPGSDLAGETAAAFASGYLVFRDVDATYAATLLQHARELYTFANENRGLYTNSIPANGFYGSTFFGDELGWAAAWLYRATGEPEYLEEVEKHWTEFNLAQRPADFAWGEKRAGMYVVLAGLSNSTEPSKFRDSAIEFCDYIVHDAPRTPKGLIYHSEEWGSLRHASNVAFVCLTLADQQGVPNAEEYREFAREQLGYALGDTGRSFVIGFGVNPPERPHHRAASCPAPPGQCLGTGDPNPSPQVLYGALVGGPSPTDEYIDDRADYMHNEVATDFNAGFQSALAALQKLKTLGKI